MNREHHDGNARELGDKSLQVRKRNALEFHADIGAGIPINDFVQFLGTLAGHVVGFYFGDSLDVFENFFDHLAVGFHFFVRNGADVHAHERVDELEERKADGCDNRNSPIEKGNHHDDEDGVENALRNHHDNACCHIAKLFHGVGGDGGDVAEAAYESRN